MKTRYIVIFHIIFWLLALTVELLPVTTIQDPIKIKDVLLQEVVVTFFCMVIFYIFYLYIAPKIISRNKIWLLPIVIIVFIVVYSYVFVLVVPPIFNLILPIRHIDIVLIRVYFIAFSYNFVYALWGTMLRFTIDWFINKQQQKDLEKHSMSSELALLRSQINPHFLFNTLNNINSFVKHDPDKASYGVIKLSEIMRYMLYESNTEKVLLENELNYIRNYIALQQLRIKDPDFVQFNVRGDVQGKLLPPMLLIPFIENAFKHGCKDCKSPGIVINVIVDNGLITFEVVNAVNKDIKKVAGVIGGLGLKNITRRLELLFKNDYSLSIEDNKERFSAKLSFHVYEN